MWKSHKRYEPEGRNKIMTKKEHVHERIADGIRRKDTGEEKVHCKSQGPGEGTGEGQTSELLAW